MRYLFLLVSLLSTPSAFANTFYPTSGRTIPIAGVIESDMLPVTDQIVKLADGSGRPIDLLIQSPGGSIAIGRTIIQAIKMAQGRGHAVRCAVVTYAASMAFSILANCSERYALPEAQMLYHPPRVAIFQAIVTPQLASQLADELRKINKEIIDELLSLYPVDRKPFLKHYYRESWHSAADLNAALGGNRTWVAVIDDIAGLKSLVGETREEIMPASGNIIYQYLPK